MDGDEMIGIIISFLLIFCTSVQAFPIVLDEPGTRGFDYTRLAGGMLRACTVNCSWDITGKAFGGPKPSDTGTFTFGPANFVIGPEMDGKFPAGPNTETFTFLAMNGNTLSGDVVWSYIEDDTLLATAFGTLSVDSSSGDMTFLKTWGGAPYDVPIHFSMSVDCSLHNLASPQNQCPTGIQEAVYVDGRLDRDRPPVVSEPGTILMLCTAMGVFLWGRRVTEKRRRSATDIM